MGLGCSGKTLPPPLPLPATFDKFLNLLKWFLGAPETINVIDAHKIDTAIYIYIFFSVHIYLIRVRSVHSISRGTYYVRFLLSTWFNLVQKCGHQVKLERQQGD